MKEILQEFTVLLEEKYPVLINNFNPGLDLEELEYFFKTKNLNLNPYVYDLFCWRNGIKIDNELNILTNWIFEDGMLFSIEEAYFHYIDATINEFVWEGEFFPLFGSGYGDFILIKQTTCENYDDFLYFFAPALLVLEPTSIYDSLPALISSLTIAYKSNIIKRDYDNKIILKELGAYSNFMKSKHPSSSYWKTFSAPVGAPPQ